MSAGLWETRSVFQGLWEGRGGALLQELEYGAANVGSDLCLGMLHRTTSHHRWNPDNPAADFKVSETFTYAGRQGAISSKAMSLDLDSTEIIQHFTWTDLGQLELDELQHRQPEKPPGGLHLRRGREHAQPAGRHLSVVPAQPNVDPPGPTGPAM